METSLKEANATSRKAAQSVLTNQVRRRLDMDQTVFRVYKGVKTFDFCKEKNVLVTGGMIESYLSYSCINLLRGMLGVH